MMRKLLFVLLMIAGFSFITEAQTPLTEAVDFTVTTVEGEELNLFEILDGGQQVVIDFFYTTCVPCQAAAPHINGAYLYFGCNSADVFFIAMDDGDTDAQCIAFDEEFGVEYPTVSGTQGGGNAVNSAYGITAFPTVILINQDHSITYQDIWPIPNPQAVITPLENAGCVETACPTGGEPTIVSTEVENRNVVLEEFTGIHCGFCPDGHHISHELMLANPEDFFPINIHQGSFAAPSAGEPDFRTPFGDAIAGQTGLTGYPAGTIDRHLFPGWQQGTGSAMSRGTWGQATNQVLAEESYVNLGAEASVDVASRELTIHVEVYYTGDSPELTNFVNVALLESNVEGPQSGGATYNPDFVLPNGNYSHQHMLRHLITEQWGEEITTTTTGSFIDLYYTYTVPGEYNEVLVNLANLDIVAFVTETTQEIESGTHAQVVVTGLENAYDAGVVGVLAPEVVCGNEITPSVVIVNNGNQNLTSLDVEYSVNGGNTQSFAWTGDLASLASETVELETVIFTPAETNEVNITVSAPNGQIDEDLSNNSGSTTFAQAVTTTLSITLELMTDNYGSETSWELLDNAGEILYSGSGYGNNTLYTEVFDIEPGDCYAFVIHDQYGDGICCNYGNGYYTLTDSDMLVVFEGGEFGLSETTEFNALVTAINDFAVASLNIYPNPAKELVNIVCDTRIQTVSITNLCGQVFQSQQVNDSFVRLNTANLNSGIYFIQIETGNIIITRKLVIK